jgi:hypothetical protein
MLIPVNRNGCPSSVSVVPLRATTWESGLDGVGVGVATDAGVGDAGVDAAVSSGAVVGAEVGLGVATGIAIEESVGAWATVGPRAGVAV